MSEKLKIPKLFIGLVACLFIAQSCALIGVRINLHNPKKAGKEIKFTKEDVLLGEMTTLRSCYDVHYYDLNLNIIPNEKTLDGTVEIHAEAVSDFQKLQIDLHPNFELTRLVDNDGIELKYVREERAVFIDLNKKIGEKFIITVDYNGSPVKAKKPPWKGGFVWKKDKNKKPWIGVACESEGASVWWPLKDHTADEPDSMRLHFTVPKDLVAVGNGQLESKYTRDEYEVFNWFVSYPINTYNVTVYVGDFKLISDEYVGINGEKLSLDYYVMEKNKDKATKHFQQVKPILKLYEERFGSYPWYRDGFKLVESPYAGMEHQTAIAYGNGYKNDLNETDYIILHEIAHEWWGNSVTARDLSDVWLQEGFATYSEALYLEDKDGEDAYKFHMFFYRLLIKNKYPVVGVSDRRWFHFRKSGDVYMKGAWILHTLRNQIANDDVFFEIIKEFYGLNKYQIIDSEQFISLVNKKTSSDYSWFFDQYLNDNKLPVLKYTTDNNGNLYYKWENMNPDFDKFRLLVKGDKQIFELYPTNKIQKLMITDSENFGSFSYQFGTDVLVIFDEDGSIKNH